MHSTDTGQYASLYSVTEFEIVAIYSLQVVLAIWMQCVSHTFNTSAGYLLLEDTLLCHASKKTGIWMA